MSTIKIDKDCDLDAIKHDGVIQKMDDHQYYVSILSMSACASCHAKGICTVSDMQDKIVEVPKEKNRTFKVGDKVEVMMEKSMGPKAVLLGYFIPFLILLITLIVMLNIVESQGVAGLVSIVVLVPYYIILYLVRERLKTAFRFRIRNTI